jgi:hypothetical protein
MLPVHDPGLFAIGSDLFLVVAAAVVGDREDFVSEVWRNVSTQFRSQLVHGIAISWPTPAGTKGAGPRP